MKRASATPAVDHGVDRTRWAQLVALAHTATETNGAADLRALSERAMAAETGWTSLAPFPRGLVCRVLARVAWAYGRQTDAAVRDRLAPMLIAAAGMVDELHGGTVATDTPTPPVEAAPLPFRRDIDG